MRLREYSLIEADKETRQKDNARLLKTAAAGNRLWAARENGTGKNLVVDFLQGYGIIKDR